MSGKPSEIIAEAKWLKACKVGGGFKEVVAICGNHDWGFERDHALSRLAMEEQGIIYLEHQAREVLGLKFFGSPYSPRFYDWAFNVDRGPKLAALWSQIPLDTEVLITHGPPYRRLDACKRADTIDYGMYGRETLSYKTEYVGCRDLAKHITLLKALRLHVFGHIHPQYGMEKGADGVTYANASTCNSQYDAVNPALVVDL
jgi:Icc-related predicted phosphoesterase